MDDGIAMVEMLLGLPGMRVLGVAEGDNELVVSVESTATVAWCRVVWGAGPVAGPHGAFGA